MDEWAARHLISLTRLAAELVWSHDPVELAEALDVDAATVRTRLAGLTADDHAAMAEAA